MRQPTLQINLDELGRIRRAYGDRRLYERTAAAALSPPLAALFRHTKSENLFPDGEPADMSGSVEGRPPVWHLDARGERRRSLRRPDAGIRIAVSPASPQAAGLRFHLSPPAAPGAQPEAPGEHALSVEFDPGELQHVLEDALERLAAEADLTHCVVSLVDGGDDTPYLCETAAVARGARELRRAREAFTASVTATPLPDEEHDADGQPDS